MSHITEIIFVTAWNDGETGWQDSRGDCRPNATIFTRYLINNQQCPTMFVEVHNQQCDMWVGASRHCDIPSMLRVFAAIQWERPECAQLLIKDEDWDRFVSFGPETALLRAFELEKANEVV